MICHRTHRRRDLRFRRGAPGMWGARWREATPRVGMGIIVVATPIVLSLASVAGGSIRGTLASYGNSLSVGPQSVLIQSNSRATAVHVYAPFRNGQLAPDVIVRKRVSGSCWTGSLAAYRRRDAWRCRQGGDRIIDPCFSDPKGSSGLVACPAQAWNRRVILLRLTKPLPLDAANPTGRGRPWAIVTTTGQHCNRLTGAIVRVEGRPLLFGCGRAGSLAGEPNTTKPLWTIYFNPSSRAGRFVKVGIAAAWR